MTHAIHPHLHAHGPGCGHLAVRHGDHVDYLHDGHLHFVHDSHADAQNEGQCRRAICTTTADEHLIDIDDANPAECAPHACAGHDASHRHGAGCGHPVVPHGDHSDYWVDGHLHHVHASHCDHHGVLPVA